MILQKLDVSINYDKNKIEELMQELEDKKIISKAQREAVSTGDIYKFTKTTIWEETRKAKEVQREKPFYINIPAKDIYIDENIDENILVQGIIDLYYITEKDKIVLVDYKTDRVKDKTELIEKYKEQLELYKIALEKALDKKVERVYIYSVYLGEEISL